MITRLTIENFKAFEYAELNLTELNLLTGMNGVGKSSVLQALLLLRQSRLTDGLALNGDLINIGLGKDAMNVQADSQSLYFKVESSRWYFEYRFKYIQDADLLPVESYKLPSIESIIHPFFLKDRFQYLNAERKSPSVIFPTSNYRYCSHSLWWTYFAHIQSVFGLKKKHGL